MENIYGNKITSIEKITTNEGDNMHNIKYNQLSKQKMKTKQTNKKHRQYVKNFRTINKAYLFNTNVISVYVFKI